MAQLFKWRFAAWSAHLYRSPNSLSDPFSFVKCENRLAVSPGVLFCRSAKTSIWKLGQNSVQHQDEIAKIAAREA
jgi:hypothetical protein